MALSNTSLGPLETCLGGGGLPFQGRPIQVAPEVTPLVVAQHPTESLMLWVLHLPPTLLHSMCLLLVLH